MTTNLGSSDYAFAVAVQNGKIVLAGLSFNGANYDFTVARCLGR